MRVNRWLSGVLLGLGLFGVTGLAVAQQDRDALGDAGRDAGESPQLEPIKDLELLESTAAARSSPLSQRPSAGDNSKLYKAARDFAAAVAGDDPATFTRVASGALQQAVAARSGIGNRINEMMAAAVAPARGPERALVSTPFGLENSVWEQPQFQRNFRDLIERAAEEGSGITPILGPPSMQRIVGPGTRVASDQEYRDCVCVGIRVGSNDQFCCTGTLVGKNVVITAGHCFFCAGAGAANKSVVFFGTDINRPGKTVTGRITRHPNYGKNGLHNDVSVIILDEDLAAPNAKPRRIATRAEIDNSTFVRAVGFGNSDFASTTGFGTKRLVDIPVASIGCSRPNDPSKFGCDKGLELVAGFIGLGPDSCNGDSGGPVYVLVGDDASKDENWAISGATSRSTNAAPRPCGDGGIHERLDQFLPFLKSVPGAHF